MTYAGPPRLPTEIGPSALEDMFDAYLVDNGLKVNEEARVILRRTFFAGAACLMLKHEHGRNIADTHGSDSPRIFQIIHTQLEKEISEHVMLGFAPVIGLKF